MDIEDRSDGYASDSELPPPTLGGSNPYPWTSVYSLFSAVISGGALAFPFAYRHTGLYGGLTFTVLVWVLEVATMLILVRAAEKFSSRNYQELVNDAMGDRMTLVVIILILLCFVGSMASYLIITGDVFGPLLAMLLGHDSIFSKRWLIMIVVALVVAFPLALQLKAKGHKWIPLLSVAALIFLLVTIIISGISALQKDGLRHIKRFSYSLESMLGIDIFLFTFQCHIQVVPIFAELSATPMPFFGASKRKGISDNEPEQAALLDASQNPSRRRTPRLAKMDGAIGFFMLLALILYCLFGAFGYIAFPDASGDVLKNFGGQSWLLQTSRVAMAVVGLLGFPLSSEPALGILEHFICGLYHLEANEGYFKRHLILSVVFVGVSLGTSLLVEDLAMVFAFVGATGIIMVVFVVPAMLLLRGYDLFGFATPEQKAALAARKRAWSDTPPDDDDKRRTWAEYVSARLLQLVAIVAFVLSMYRLLWLRHAN